MVPPFCIRLLFTLLFVSTVILVYIITSVKYLITFLFYIVILLLFNKKQTAVMTVCLDVSVVFLFVYQVQCIDPAAGKSTHESAICIL